MQEAMKNCIQNIRVLPFLLDAVYNIKEWLALHAEHHTQPKCFKFVRNATGKCEMFYRNYSHMSWEGPVVILKVQLKPFKYFYVTFMSYYKCPFIVLMLKVKRKRNEEVIF